jgi:copper chaperone CopZ
MTTATYQVTGMTCEHRVHAVRIEKKLNKLDGGTATVNFATEKASVRSPAAVSPEELISGGAHPEAGSRTEAGSQRGDAGGSALR